MKIKLNSFFFLSHFFDCFRCGLWNCPPAGLGDVLGNADEQAAGDISIRLLRGESTLQLHKYNTLEKG